MIIFKQEEYNAWASLNEKFLRLHADARRRYSTSKNRAAYDRELRELEYLECEERNAIEEPAKRRTVKNFSNKRLFEDAQATIYYHAYRAYAEAEATGSDPDFSAYGGIIDLRIDEHLVELRDDRHQADKADLLWDLVERYKAGDISREECEPFKDYELIRVEIPVNKSMAPIREDAGTALVIANTVYPKEFMTTTDKVSNKLFDGAIAPLVETTVANARRGSAKELNTVITINYDDLQEIQLLNRPKGLTAYDREVNDAVLSLSIVGGNEFFTDQMIYRVMTGNPSAKLSKAQQEKITQSIALLRGTIVKISVSEEEAQAYGVEAINYEGNLLMIERVEVKIKGQNANAFRLRRAPILYEYAEGKNQIARVPMEIVNTDIVKTTDIIELQGYLLRRIMAMKGSTMSRTILYSTIFDKLNIGENLANKGQVYKKRSKINDSIIRILDEWKEKTFIVDYKVNKKGNSTVSVTITP